MNIVIPMKTAKDGDKVSGLKTGNLSGKLCKSHMYGELLIYTSLKVKVLIP